MPTVPDGGHHLKETSDVVFSASSTDVSSFQMNDSSYDSLENELNDDPESPYQEELPLRDKDKPDSRSRDSVITLSDCDPDPDPESDLLLQLPPLARPRRFNPASRQPRGRQANGSPSQAPRRLRRSSEPALALENSAPVLRSAELARPAARKASYDAAMEGQSVDEVFLEERLGGLQLKEEEEEVEKGCGRDKGGAKAQSGGRRRSKNVPPPPLRLDASCSSLSSPATSPTGSSLSSLDSAFSQYSTDYNSNHIEPAPPLLLLPVPHAGRHQPSPRGSPPTRTGHAHGLHPNTWLKKEKERRLSLKQPDNGNLEVEEGAEPPPVANGKSHPAGAQDAASNRNCRRRSSSPPSYQQALLQLQHSRSPFYRGSEKPLTVREFRQLHDRVAPPTGSEIRQGPEAGALPPQGVFFGQSGTALVLQRQKSNPPLTPAAVEAQNRTRTLPRRASEPAPATRNLNLTSGSRTLGRPRPSKYQTQDMNGGGPAGESGFSLSPTASRAVRDYFTSQGQDNADAALRRSQEVALAIVQGKREWQSRRCSDPRVDEFEQLFFAEESYV